MQSPAKQRGISIFLGRLFTSLIGFIVGGVCLATGFSFFASDWWVFELTSHFRIQYFLVLLVSSLVCISRAHYKWGVAAGFVALLNLALLVPFETVVHAKSSSAKTESRSFRAVLLNVNHANDDYRKIYDYIRLVNPDFLLLLEVNEKWMSNLQKLRDKFAYSKGQAHPEYGILLMSQVPIDQTAILFLGEERIPTVMAQFTLQNKQNVTLLGTHPRSPMSSAHAQSRNDQLRNIAKFVSQQPNPVVLLGDLNVTPWSPVFQDFLTHSGLRDSMEGMGLQPTWPTTFPLAWIPIDHCLISSEVLIRKRQVGPNIGSDHYPLVVDFSIRS